MKTSLITGQEAARAALVASVPFNAMNADREVLWAPRSNAIRGWRWPRPDPTLLAVGAAVILVWLLLLGAVLGLSADLASLVATR